MEGEYSTTSSDGEEEIEAVAAFVILDEENRRKRRTWVHEINTKREKLGEYHKLVPELRKDPKRFHMYFRMSIEKFDYLHELIEDHLQKENAQLRKAISTAERLTVCVR
ncbi:hypothetical protein HHI36_002427 [Cryptolaemus montrouzieri]|uniref:Uncharacterized protein n=1 Tax=Cryptolaemus montrouzieri TaxID=559131 RepID=A0ABD2PAF7_9CUCU